MRVWVNTIILKLWMTFTKCYFSVAYNLVVIAWPRTRWNLRSSTIELLKLPALREEMMQLAEWSLDYLYFALCEKVV